MPAFSIKPAHLAVLLAFALILVALPHQALADGIPQPWGIGMQEPASQVQAYVDYFHDVLLYIIGSVCVFVLGLLLYVIVRYNKWANPVPSRTTHNIKLEIIWTVIPCLILIGIAFISFPLLYYSDQMPKPDVTLKVTGRQWYWSYEYPDNGGIAYDSHAIWDLPNVTDADAAKLIADSVPGWLIKNKPQKMLEVDNRVVLPVGKNIRVQITGGDVEHSWFIPALGVNRMAVPGKLTELWLKITHEGIYYGQCSMICGNGHGYMPIAIEGVTPEKFDTWVKSKKTAVGQAAPSNQMAVKQD